MNLALYELRRLAVGFLRFTRWLSSSILSRSPRQFVVLARVVRVLCVLCLDVARSIGVLSSNTPSAVVGRYYYV